MPEPKPAVKKAPSKQTTGDRLQAIAENLLRQLFGLTKGWHKQRDILQNNYNLGQEHLNLGHYRDAVFRFKIVTWIDPNYFGAWYGLGCAYLGIGEKSPARQALKKALQLKPGDEETTYMLAMAGGIQAPVSLPRRVPPSLALTYFEGLAPFYAEEQLEVHQYRGHTLLVEAIRTCLTPGRIDHVMLDLGVGTGLCGPGLREVAAQLTGVDISAAMLAEAMKLQDENGKKIYDALIKREMHEFLQEAPAAAYDVVLAAGAFSYMGELEAVFAQVSRVLKPGGLFAFTADKQDSPGFTLDTELGRFHFSAEYLKEWAAANGLKALRFEEAETYPTYRAWLCVFAR